VPPAPSLHSIDTQIARRVQRSARGTVFTPDSFAALGSRASIDKALQRIVARGELRRLSRGLYDKPRQDELLAALGAMRLFSSPQVAELFKVLEQVRATAVAA
jgi:hypothetical protein